VCVRVRVCVIGCFFRAYWLVCVCVCVFVFLYVCACVRAYVRNSVSLCTWLSFNTCTINSSSCLTLHPSFLRLGESPDEVLQQQTHSSILREIARRACWNF